jgi:hypothetical protein
VQIATAVEKTVRCSACATTEPQLQWLVIDLVERPQLRQIVAAESTYVYVVPFASVDEVPDPHGDE